MLEHNFLDFQMKKLFEKSQFSTENTAFCGKLWYFCYRFGTYKNFLDVKLNILFRSYKTLSSVGIPHQSVEQKVFVMVKFPVNFLKDTENSSSCV